MTSQAVSGGPQPSSGQLHSDTIAKRSEGCEAMPQRAAIVEWWGPYATLEEVHNANNEPGYVLCKALGDGAEEGDAPRYRYITSGTILVEILSSPLMVSWATLATRASIWVGLPLSVPGSGGPGAARRWKRRSGRSSTRFARSLTTHLPHVLLGGRTNTAGRCAPGFTRETKRKLARSIRQPDFRQWLRSTRLNTTIHPTGSRYSDCG